MEPHQEERRQLILDQAVVAILAAVRRLEPEALAW